METICFSETLSTYESPRRHNPEEQHGLHVGTWYRSCLAGVSDWRVQRETHADTDRLLGKDSRATEV
jgi:hypothetical protein